MKSNHTLFLILSLLSLSLIYISSLLPCQLDIITGEVDKYLSGADIPNKLRNKTWSLGLQSSETALQSKTDEELPDLGLSDGANVVGVGASLAEDEVVEESLFEEVGDWTPESHSVPHWVSEEKQQFQL